ncbi:MAG TPA: hypothetical protein PKW95_21495 [bacterium]|nr:hypothetical protein [bacterium]
MSKFRFAEDGGSPGGVSAVLTRLFDALLIGGYLACLVLTVMLLRGDHAPVAPPVPAAVSETPAPAEQPPAGEISPTPAPPPTPTPETSGDLVEAMRRYVHLINAEEYSAALRMRGDDNIPTLDRMKQTNKMTLLACDPYPRVSRREGSVFIELMIEKQNKTSTWKGRIDWELRHDRWVTVKWDSSAPPPSAPPIAPQP